MTAYYNEFDPFAAAWLRELIKANLIAPGDVDERSITEVKADDLKGYTQCHFFAGIGGWSYALRIALWPDDRPVWTGSCPCQPFSSAGTQSRQSDERHLWPVFSRLIGECAPTTIFGEQVDEAIATGWWDDVCHDLEDKAYSCAAAILPATSVQKNHERFRLFFIANSQMQQGVYEPYDREKEKGLHNYGTSWGTNTWDETMPKVHSIYDGFSSPVGIYHGFGNAIVPQVAAEFIKAYKGCI